MSNDNTLIQIKRKAEDSNAKIELQEGELLIDYADDNKLKIGSPEGILEFYDSVAVENKINELDFQDTETADMFVTSVSQTDGIVSTTKKQVQLVDSKVKLSSPLYLTQSLGRLTPAMNPVGKKSNGDLMTLRELLEDAFCYTSSDSLVTKDPSYTFTASAPSAQEVGTTKMINATFSYTDGAYRYGRWSGGKPDFANKNMGVTYSSPSSETITVTFKDSSQSTTISGKTTRSAATYAPINYKGEQQVIPAPYNDKAEISISTSSISIPAGQRYKFYGTCDTIPTTYSAVYNAFKNTKTLSSSANFTAQKGAKYIVVVCPSENPTIKYEEMGNFVPLTFERQPVAITIGAPILNGSEPSRYKTDYYVHVYTADQTTGLGAAMNMKITF